MTMIIVWSFFRSLNNHYSNRLQWLSGQNIRWEIFLDYYWKTFCTDWMEDGEEIIYFFLYFISSMPAQTSPNELLENIIYLLLYFPCRHFHHPFIHFKHIFRFTYFAIGIFPPINKQFSIYSIIRCIFSYTYSFCRGLYILCVYTFYAFHVASTHNQYLSVYRFPQESATNWKTVKLNWNVLIRVRLPALSSVLEVF